MKLGRANESRNNADYADDSPSPDAGYKQKEEKDRELSDRAPALFLGLAMLVGVVAGMGLLAGGKQGVKDLFAAMGWMWLLIIGGGVLVALLISLG